MADADDYSRQQPQRAAGGFSREVARRVFAEELRNSNLAFREGEDQNQYAPQYLLTPTGARCNRVFLVGTLTERDDIGGDSEYWRGRVVDPTGSILVYAGQYQPEAAQALASIEPPAFVAVVGKPSRYQTEDGKILISVRAESIQRADNETMNCWILETAHHTLERLNALNVSGTPIAAFSTADKTPVSDDVERAKSHYHTDVEQYRQMVLRGLNSLLSDLTERPGIKIEVPEDRVKVPQLIETSKETPKVEAPEAKVYSDLQIKPEMPDKALSKPEMEVPKREELAIRNRAIIDKGLDLLKRGLLPYVEDELKAKYNEDWWTLGVEPNLSGSKVEELERIKGSPEERYVTLDIYSLLQNLWKNWDSIWKDKFDRTVRTYVRELQDTRNKWAHQENFTTDDVYRALDTMRRLLVKISALEEAEKVRSMAKEVRDMMSKENYGVKDAEYERMTQSDLDEVEEISIFKKR